MLNDQIGRWKSNMATSKPEVSLSLLVDMVGTQFQRLYLYFRGPRNYQQCCTNQPEVKNPNITNSKQEVRISQIAYKI